MNEKRKRVKPDMHGDGGEYYWEAFERHADNAGLSCHPEDWMPSWSLWCDAIVTERRATTRDLMS